MTGNAFLVQFIIPEGMTDMNGAEICLYQLEKMLADTFKAEVYSGFGGAPMVVKIGRIPNVG